MNSWSFSMSSPSMTEAARYTSTRSRSRQPVREVGFDFDDTRQMMIAVVLLAMAAFAVGFFGLTAFVAAGSAMARPAAYAPQTPSVTPGR
jgi:hypothetical protein